MQNITSEAMGLASMNPVVGTNSNAGSFLVNVTNHDKDLEDDSLSSPIDGNGIGLVTKLDMDNNLYGIDSNGKFYAKHKFDIMKRKDITEIYKIEDDDAISYLAEQFEEEANMPYEDRPIHGLSYIYEVVTGKRLLTEDQLDYDPMLTKVDISESEPIEEEMEEIPKFSLGLQGQIADNETEEDNHMKQRGIGYIPDVDYPNNGRARLFENYDRFSLSDY